MTLVYPKVLQIVPNTKLQCMSIKDFEAKLESEEKQQMMCYTRFVTSVEQGHLVYDDKPKAISVEKTFLLVEYILMYQKQAYWRSLNCFTF